MTHITEDSNVKSVASIFEVDKVLGDTGPFILVSYY